MPARVLIADDDAVVRDVVRRYLERDGLEVRMAGDGNEALRLLGTERIDVAVLDVMMPGPNGLSLCRTLRQGGDYSVPVILLTALGEEDDRIAGLEAGADDYLTKPFSPRELVARIRAVLRRTSAAVDSDAAPIEMGQLVIDPLRHDVTTAGEIVDLTPTEFTLLHGMASAPGRAFSRGQLLDLLGQDYLGLERTIDS
ncbi:MAG: response regulator transcription factor, partial [Mycobacterium sp.]|nr:response regulator transcription factor [Mycobacterium sp.]